MEYILTTEGLTRRFGNTCAVNQVSLHIREGEIYGLIGRNGAGKTTLLKMIGGLIRTTSGSVTVLGEDIQTALMSGKMAKVGTLIEAPGLQNGMTGYDNIRLKCICAGIADDPAYINSLLETVGLSDAAKKKAGNYSLGMRQRLGIALALVGEPKILVLDEPINGLDPQGIAEVREMLLKLNRERHITILISSHILNEMDKLATTCGIIEKGVLLKEFNREQIERECTGCIVIRADDLTAAQAVLREHGYAKLSVTEEKTLEVRDDNAEIPVVIMILAQAGVPVREIKMQNQSLEDFFFNVVGGAKNG